VLRSAAFRRFARVLVLACVVTGCTGWTDGVGTRDYCAALPASAIGDGGDAGEGGGGGAGGEGGALSPAPLPGADFTPDWPSGSVTDAYVEGVTIAVHDRVKTVLAVTWTQIQPADETWLEFAFESGSVMRSRAQPGSTGSHRDVVLGVPADTEVRVRIVARAAGMSHASSEYRATTGSLPSRMPVGTVFAHDPERASPERWLFGSVEDSLGGGYAGYYYRTFWLYLMDRKGRIVWYYADPSSNATSSFQRIARDGEYVWIEKRSFNGSGKQSVVKTTLDGEYFEEISVPGLSDCIDVTADGSLLYDVRGELRELTRNGETRSIWSCRSHFGQGYECYTNTVNWYEAEDTVLLSFPYQNTVVEIARATGEVVGQYGNGARSYTFAPPREAPPSAWSLSFQHFPNRTPSGTLLVSSHVPGCTADSQPGPGRHAFVEFTIDREARELVETWRYTDGPEWPRAKGMAVRLSNGNTLVNYGTGGVIREVTPEGRTVFGVKFDVNGGSDFYNKMVGHNVVIDDLYALNSGPR